MTSQRGTPKRKVIHSSPLAAALAYATKRNWRVFPLNGKRPHSGTHGHRDATTDPVQIRRWWSRWPNANVGIACSSTRGPIVIDIDGRSGARLIGKLGLPETREASSRLGRRHLYFAPMADGTAIKRTIRPMGSSYAFDILGDGGYVVAPPSVHPDTGSPYKWVRKVPLAPFPPEALQLLHAPKNPGQVASLMPDVIREGERDSVLTSLAGSMRRRGASKGAILAALHVENTNRVQPPLAEDQIEKIAHSIASKTPALRADDSRSVVKRLSEVKPERVKWLVPNFLPYSKFALIEGDPGQGKSTLTLEIAARITKGRSVFGEAPGKPRNVVLVTYEDGLADTVRPRIDALGGDPNRVIVFRGVLDGNNSDDERQPTFPDDTQRLRAIVEEYKAALVVVDPLGAALSDSTDSHKDASVRRVVSQLSRVAEDTGACVLGVRHLTKAAASNAVRAGGGSIAFIGASRVALLVSEHPDDNSRPQHERRRVLATVKNNLAPHPRSRMFVLEQHGRHEHPRVRWVGECDLTADDLNAAHATAAPEDHNAVKGIDDWLREYLSEGTKPVKEVYLQGRNTGGWDKTQLWRSLKRVGGHSKREGFGAGARYVWTTSSASVAPE